MPEVDWDKVEYLERRERWAKRLVPIALIFLVVGILFPWVSWEAHEDVEPGSLTGVDILNSDSPVTGYVPMVILGTIASFLAYKARGRSSLGNFFVFLLGLLVVAGLAMLIHTPWDLLLESDPPKDWMYVHAEEGLFMGLFGGIWITLLGLYSLVQRLRINMEATSEPPY